MSCLANIYKDYLTNSHGVPEAVKGIKDKILTVYHLPGIEDKMLVEELFYTYLVPSNLEPEERMKKLLQLFATIDESASKAFIEIQKQHMQVN
jgi:hypothetical protein